jgi:ketosteroid isomerase-like protein
MKKTVTVLCTLAIFGWIGCSQADNRTADAQALKDNEARWNQDYASKDVDKIMAHYADNATVMAPGIPASVGKEAIRKTITTMASDPAMTLQFQALQVEVSKSGDLGYTHGTYQMTMTDPASKKVVHDHGSYVTTYSKQADGTWKAVADIATSEVAPDTMASAKPSK